jgi:hypothetical protein
MALTKTVLNTTRHSLTLLLEEAGTAAAELAVALAGDCAEGPLKTLLSGEFADAAAARAAIYANVDVMIAQRAGSAGDSVHLCVDYDDNSEAFEANFICAKGGDTDTGDFVVTFRYRHSLTK